MISLVEMLAIGAIDDAGAFVADGTVDFYEAGTTKRRTVYSNRTLTTALPNPATLDSSGKRIAFSNTRLRLVIKDSNGVTVRSVDNVGYGAKDIESSDLANNIIVTRVLANSLVTTAKIKDAAMSTRKFANLQVTRAKYPTITAAISSSVTYIEASNPGTNVDPSGFTVTLTCSGRPLMLGIQSDGSVNAAYASISGGAVWAFFRDGVSIGKYNPAYTSFFPQLIPSVFTLMDVPSAGSHTYKVRLVTSTQNTGFTAVKLFAYEL